MWLNIYCLCQFLIRAYITNSRKLKTRIKSLRKGFPLGIAFMLKFRAYIYIIRMHVETLSRVYSKSKPLKMKNETQFSEDWSLWFFGFISSHFIFILFFCCFKHSTSFIQTNLLKWEMHSEVTRIPFSYSMFFCYCIFFMCKKTRSSYTRFIRVWWEEL